MQDSFRIFTLPHSLFLLSLPAIAWGLAVLARSAPGRKDLIRTTLGVTLLMNEVAWYGYYIAQGWFVFPYSVPLQMCDILVWIAAATALTESPSAYTLLYYWGLTGTSMALLTPDVTTPTFSYLTIRFFVSHGGIFVILLYLTWSKSLTPQPGSWWRALLGLHLYAAVIAIYNVVFDTNFFYLRQKPLEASLLDYMGPWPYYILVGDALAMTLFYLLWLPFRRQKVEVRDGS